MTANVANSLAEHSMVNLTQAPAQRADAEVARAMQDVQTARQQAQQAEQQAQVAQQQAQAAQQDAQRQVQQEMQRARREIDRAIREAQRDAGRAGRAGQPGGFPPFPGGGSPFPGGGPQIPEGAVVMSVAFFVMCAVIAIGYPIARAIARRMDRRGFATAGADPDTRSRLERIEQAVDAIAVEVERISEGQRFTTRLMNDLRALPQPDPSVAVPDRAAVPIARARDGR